MISPLRFGHSLARPKTFAHALSLRLHQQSVYTVSVELFDADDSIYRLNRVDLAHQAGALLDRAEIAALADQLPFNLTLKRIHKKLEAYADEHSDEA